jgi:HEAT repeat protein
MERSISATVLLPLAIPPVKPRISTPASLPKRRLTPERPMPFPCFRAVFRAVFRYRQQAHFAPNKSYLQPDREKLWFNLTLCNPSHGTCHVISETPLQHTPSHEDVSAALIKLVKLIKTVCFYPLEHPAPREAGAEALAAFRPLLKSSHVILKVRKDGLLHHEEPIGRNLPMVKNLAYFLFARRVHSLLFLPDLTARDLNAFARCSALKPTVIQSRGGLQELLLRERTGSIWVNEIDLTRIREAKASLEASRQAEPSATDGANNPIDGDARGNTAETGWDGSLEELLTDQLSLEQIVAQLPREESDRRFTLLLSKLTGLFLPPLTENDLPGLLAAFQVLAGLIGNRRFDRQRRQETLQALLRLSTPELLAFLIDVLCTRDRSKVLRENIMRILVFLQDRTVAPLMERLSAETNAQVGKLLAETLVRQGLVAVPQLLPSLQDERWYVVRNTVAILGRIGDTRTVTHLRPLLWHEDLRIAREAARAMIRIGGPHAAKALVQLLREGPEKLYPQAILALGVMKDAAAVPCLMKIVKKRDLMMKGIELKIGAIKALGRIGSPEVIPFLERLARRRVLWQRARFNSLRIQAIKALGQIGSESSEAVLEALAQDRHPSLAKTASLALKHLRRQ